MEEKKGFCGENLTTHFVLNSLGTIQYLIENDAKAASKLMADFISYTKTTLRWEKAEGLNLLSQELSYLKVYEKIMSARFGESFSVIYEISASDFSVPYFTLKKLVETSFYQGVRDLGKEGKILVKTYEEKGKGVLEVSHNGIPFSLDENVTLQQLKTAVTKETGPHATAEIKFESNKVIFINQSL